MPHVLRCSIFLLTLASGCTQINDELLIQASISGNLDAVKRLVDNGVNINARSRRVLDGGETPISAAAGSGQLEVVKYLISKGADLNAAADNGVTPIDNAILGRNLPCARALQEAGAKFDPSNLLLLAVPNSDVETILWIAGLGANLDVVDSNGDNPLACAIQYDATGEAIKALVRLGVKKDVANKFGQTARDIAREHNRKELE